MGWLVLSLGAMICWALWVVLAKASGLPWKAALFWLQGTQGALALTLLLTGDVEWHGKRTALALLSGAANFAGVALFYAALREGRTGIVVPLTALYPAVAVALGALFLREAWTLRQAAGVAAALLAVALLARE